MSEKDLTNACNEEQCVHFIEKNKLHFYRKKFMWIVIIFSVACAGMLAWLVYHHDSQLNTIVKQHENYVSAQTDFLKEARVNKATIYVNETVLQSIELETKTIENLLQMQTAHQHSQFTLLSVWAGVLMIVFLVFSLYSMFKTDELVKQARESINTIGNSKSEVDHKLQEVDAKVATEVEHIKTISNEYIGEIKRQIQEEQSKVSQNIQSTGEELKQAYATHKEKLAEMQRELQLIVQGVSTVVEAVNKTGTSEKEIRNTGEKDTNNKH